MKVQTRPFVFETNSSMTHSLVILPEADMKRWELENKTYIYDDWDTTKFGEKTPENNKLYTISDLIDFIKEVEPSIDVDEDYATYMAEKYGFYDFDSWPKDYADLDDLGYYTSPSGDKFVIRYCCGYDN